MTKYFVYHKGKVLVSENGQWLLPLDNKSLGKQVHEEATKILNTNCYVALCKQSSDGFIYSVWVPLEVTVADYKWVDVNGVEVDDSFAPILHAVVH